MGTHGDDDPADGTVNEVLNAVNAINVSVSVSGMKSGLLIVREENTGLIQTMKRGPMQSKVEENACR